MAKYNDPKTGKTVEAKNAKEARELMKPKKETPKVETPKKKKKVD